MTPGEAIQWFFTFLGAAAAAQQLWNWTTGRREAKGLRIFLERYADDGEAAEAREELQRLEGVVEELRSSTPELVRILSLQQRRDDLARTIGALCSDHIAVQSRLGEQEAMSQLSPLARQVVEAEVLPWYRRERRRQDQTRILAVFILLLLILPYPVTPAYIVPATLDLSIRALLNPNDLGSLMRWSGLIIVPVAIATGLRLYAIARRVITKSLSARFITAIQVTCASVAALLLTGSLYMTLLGETDFDNQLYDSDEKLVATSHVLVLILLGGAIGVQALRRHRTLPQ